MAVKQDALLLTSSTLYQGATLRIAFCSGSWAEATSTRNEIFSSEVAINGLRPAVEFTSATYNQADNTLLVQLDLAEPYNPLTSFVTNRLALLRNSRELGACTITSVVGNVIRLGTGYNIDWQAGDEVRFSNNTGAVIQSVNNASKTVTLNAIPAGVTTSVTVTNMYGLLLEAKAFSAITLSTGVDNVITLTRELSGL